jgi:hypothetical protein
VISHITIINGNSTCKWPEAIPQASNDVAGSNSLMCHHCGTMCHQGSKGSRPGHWGQDVVYSRNLCPYVDRRWHTPSIGELRQSNIKAVILRSILSSIVGTLLARSVSWSTYAHQFMCINRPIFVKLGSPHFVNFQLLIISSTNTAEIH